MRTMLCSASPLLSTCVLGMRLMSTRPPPRPQQRLQDDDPLAKGNVPAVLELRVQMGPAGGIER